MPVIDLTTRSTTEETEFKKFDHSDKSKILVNPSESLTRYSIELHLGSRWSERYGIYDSSMYEMVEPNVKIRKWGSIVIEVSGRISIPQNAYGIIVPTGSLFLDRGIIIGAGKIEPNFHGVLRLRLFNTNPYSVELPCGAKIASAIILETETTVTNQMITHDIATVAPRQRWWHRPKAWMRENWPQVVTWMVTASFGAVAATVLVPRIGGN